MRAIVQRVSEASVKINRKTKGEIDFGFLILLGVEEKDELGDADWLAKKVATLRVFSDQDGNMNLDLNQVNGRCLVISQFTLHAKTKKGTRPSFKKAAKPEKAIPLYKRFNEQLANFTNTKIETGEFGANMQVGLINDGPVTIIIDTHNKE